MTRQIECLRPSQIEAALAQRSLIYLPLGTIEWHCHHLPVGLDALTAHGVCLRAADQTGGLVWPPLYYGTGGDHGAFPWTVMMPGDAEITALLEFTLKRLNVLGVQQVVLFSGHFADTQLAMIDKLAARWQDQGLQVRALAVNRADIAGFPPDHAGRFETTLLEGMLPETIEAAALGNGPDSLDRFDPNSPLWGIVGADPRLAPPMAAPALVGAMIDWAVAEVGSQPLGQVQILPSDH